MPGRAGFPRQVKRELPGGAPAPRVVRQRFTATAAERHFERTLDLWRRNLAQPVTS